MKAEAQAGGVLAEILAATRRRVTALRLRQSHLESEARRAPARPSFAAALAGESVAVIAEVKKRSPSAGDIRAGADAAELASCYARAGAAAISVLTEPERFGGSIEDLERVVAAVALPVLRKDFIIDPVQLYEARAAGASAVLLIVRALSRERLAELAALARAIGLETLVEVHDHAELGVALGVQPAAVGVNARDLETLRIDASAAGALLSAVPEGVPAVAESGLRGRADVARVAARGADAVLVGTAVAGADDPARAIAALCGVPRTGRRPA
jgi:indole-3-glycerol phosphate synthase